MVQRRRVHWILGAVLLGAGPVPAWCQTAALLPRLAMPSWWSSDRAGARAGAAVSDAGVESAAAAIDLTLPVLTALSAGSTLDVGKATPPFSVLVKAQDDLSGVLGVAYFATGPSGQRIFGVLSGDYPALGLSRRGGFAQMYVGRLLEPGAWVVTEAAVTDGAGNIATYDSAALAALGNTKFKVINPGTYDAVAPTLTSGQILTPTVSLSAFAKGTPNLAPYVGIKLTASDTGSTAVAGLAGAGATFCVADASRCIDLAVTTPNGGNQPSGTLVLGSQVASVLGQSPGDYVLSAVLLWDQAGNVRELVSTAFGGTTNFGKYFASTRITLKP